MGGGGRNSPGIGDIRSLIDKAKEEIRRAERQTKRNVFISFAYEDNDEVNLLRAHARNENLPIEFNDWSVSEPIDSERSIYIKQKIAERIRRSSVTIVYLSDHTINSKWVKWEVEESVRQGKKILGVYKGDNPPSKIPASLPEHNIKTIKWSDLATALDALSS